MPINRSGRLAPAPTPGCPDPLWSHLFCAVVRKRGRLTAVVCLLAVLAASATPAGAASTDQRTRELEQRRRDLARERSAAAAAVDVLRASEEELERALARLTADVLAKEARLSIAQVAAEAAAAHSAKLQDDERLTAARLAQLREEMRRIAVDAFVHGPTGALDVAMGGKDITEALQREQMLKVVVDKRSDVTIQLRRATQELGLQRTAAAAASALADAEQRGVESELLDLQVTVAAQQRLVVDMENRLEARLGEVDALATIDQQVADQLRARQVELAREAAAREAAAREAAARLEAARLEAAQLAAARASRSAAAAAATPAPRPTATPTTTPRTAPQTVIGPTGGISTVRGIRVATSLAPNLEALLAAASAAGMSYGGGGYRDAQAQIATRINNCGPTQYDIYEKPASQCSPPTARPGLSMHEQGLAVDFTYNGSLITTKTNPGFVWLAANASRYGLYNLPSEPWHWSVNGN